MNWDLTADQIRINFPPLFSGDDSITDAEIDLAFALAQQIHRYNKQAIHYCTAHLIALYLEQKTSGEKVDGGLGEVIQETLGPQVRLYKSVAGEGNEAFFTTTHWGRNFLILQRRVPERQFGGILIA